MTSKDVPHTWPQMESIFEPENTEPFLRRVEKTCKQLSRTIAEGSPTEQRRAAAALLAFGRATDLVKELGELRFKAAEETSARSPR
jgi:hypothetical protein